MVEHISPWPEQRPPRTEAQRTAFAEEQSAHLPKPSGDGTLVSDFDLAAMRAANLSFAYDGTSTQHKAGCWTQPAVK